MLFIVVGTPLTEVFNRVRKIAVKLSEPIPLVLLHAKETVADLKTDVYLLSTLSVFQGRILLRQEQAPAKIGNLYV